MKMKLSVSDYALSAARQEVKHSPFYKIGPNLTFWHQMLYCFEEGTVWYIGRRKIVGHSELIKGWTCDSECIFLLSLIPATKCSSVQHCVIWVNIWATGSIAASILRFHPMEQLLSLNSLVFSAASCYYRQYNGICSYTRSHWIMTFSIKVFHGNVSQRCKYIRNKSITGNWNRSYHAFAGVFPMTLHTPCNSCSLPEYLRLHNMFESLAEHHYLRLATQVLPSGIESE